MLSRNPSQASAPPGTAVSDPSTAQQASADSVPGPLKASSSTEPLNVPTPPPGSDLTRKPSVQRSTSSTRSGESPQPAETMASPVMHETLTVIDEHITDMSTPRHSAVTKDLRANDSGSEYSSHHRLSYINGEETDDEEQEWHTEEDVRTWSPARVAEYLLEAGVEKRHCDVFREQDIDGEALLGVDRNFIFMQEFNLGPMGPRLRTWMKINALQSEVKNAKEPAMHHFPAMESHEDFPPDPARPETGRNRAASTSAVLPRIPTLRESMGSRGNASRQNIPRTSSSAGRSIASTMDAGSPLIQHTPASPALVPPGRPSAASVRSMNHNRRHSSIDYNQGPATPASVKSSSVSGPAHKKAPSFDRSWTMGGTMARLQQDMKRPSSSHHAHSSSVNGTMFDTREDRFADAADLDRGYFSGGEVDNRKNRNVLRKKDSPGHSRNPSYSTESGRRTSSRRHSRIASTDSAVPAAPVSAAAKQYYGTSIKSERSSSAFDFVLPLKPTTNQNPTVTKLAYDSPSIDAVAASPAVAGSETSSTGRASPSPAVATHSPRSFFGKKHQTRGLRAISDAITGGEKASVSAAELNASPNKESPMHSPARTGSSTPSEPIAKSLDFDKSGAAKKRLTDSSAATKESGRRRNKKHATSAYQKGRFQITPQEAMEHCDYSGWMKKKSSSLMTTWKTRLFVLRGRRLAYYYTENDTEEKGLIDISSHRVLPANNERMTGLHAALTRAAASPTSPQNATIQTAASSDSATASPSMEEDLSGIFIFKLVPPRAGLQKGVQFTKPIVHYFAVDSLAVGRLWMAALMKATIDRDEALPFTTTYQQKTISLDKARAMRQRPPNLMDDDDADTETGSADNEKKSQYSKESIQDSVIHEVNEKGLGISDFKDAKALLAFADQTESNVESTEHKLDSKPAVVAT